MNRYALIVAGGSGTRMGNEIPKQFLELAGKPVLMRTIERFRAFDITMPIIVVIPVNQFACWESLKKKYTFSIPHIIVAGGPTRFHSVKNGLEITEESSLTAIHDGVRPLVSTQTIKRCFDVAEKYGNAVPVITPPDSVRMVTKQGNISLNRQYLKIVQTPQVFDTGMIRKAYIQDYSPDFTDDAIVLEKTGETIHLVEGNRENLKITNPEDLVLAETLLKIVF